MLKGAKPPNAHIHHTLCGRKGCSFVTDLGRGYLLVRGNKLELRRRKRKSQCQRTLLAYVCKYVTRPSQKSWNSNNSQSDRLCTHLKTTVILIVLPMPPLFIAVCVVSRLQVAPGLSPWLLHLVCISCYFPRHRSIHFLYPFYLRGRIQCDTVWWEAGPSHHTANTEINNVLCVLSLSPRVSLDACRDVAGAPRENRHMYRKNMPQGRVPAEV